MAALRIKPPFGKAIRTKYAPATNSRGAGIVVSVEGQRSSRISYDHSADDAHASAVLTYLARRGLDWSGTLVSGGLPDGSRAFVFVR